MSSHARFARRRLAAAAVVALASMTAVARPGRATAQTTSDDPYEWLHDDWARFLPRSAECTWPTFYVDPRAERGGDGSRERPFATVDEALAAADDPAICGPTLFLSPGDHELGRLILAKPTILRGESGTRLIASIVNVAALPLWLEDLTLADAPSPAAILAAHPRAETTLVRVRIANAAGIGALVHSGRLEIRDSLIEEVRGSAGSEGAIGDLTSILPRTGPYTPSHLARLQEVVATLPEGVVAPLLPLDLSIMSPLHLGALLLDCAGTGLYASGGAHVVLSGVTLLDSNDRAGLVATGLATFVEGKVWALANGATGPPPPNNAVALLEKGYCMGGIQVRQDAFVNLSDTLANGNNHAGVIVHHGGMSFFDGLSTQGNAELFGLTGLGDGMLGFQGSLAVQNFSSTLNGQAGIQLQGSQFYLSKGSSSQNDFGIIADVCDIEDYLVQHDVLVSGNTEDVVIVNPTCGLGFPPPPPVPE
jgi:hypothetical protein